MQQHWKEISRYGTVGLELALSILFGLFIGRWLDRKFETEPWLTLIGLGFGIAAGVRSVWRALEAAKKAAEKEEERERRERKEFHDRHDN